MRKFTKELSIALAVLMLLPTMVGAYASKQETEASVSTSSIDIINDASDDQGLEIEDLEDASNGDLIRQQELEISEVRADLLQAQKAVEGIEVDENDKEYTEVLEKYNEAVVKLDGEINDFERQLKQSSGISRQQGSGIYDVTSIPARVQLLIRIGRAIRFGTTELSNKVVAAHTRLTEYIMVGILHTLNPFVSEGTIMEYIQSFEALEQELLSYPDLSPHDIATIYKKSAYHRTIAEARKVRNEANRTGRKFQAKKLNEVISQSAALWWRITVTCGELDEQEAKLLAAMEVITGPKIRVDKVEFMEGNKGAINLNYKTKLSPVLLPVEAKNKDYFIISTNPYVARVIGDEIVPIKTGSVKIECISKDSAVKGVFELTILHPGEYSSLPMLEPTGSNDSYEDDGTIVEPGPVGNDSLEVKDLSFTRSQAELRVGEEYDLGSRVLVFPERAEDKSLSFESLDSQIAEVDENGLVLALNPGQTKIRVRAASGVERDFPLVVIEEVENEYSIDEISLSDRKAGVFKVQIKASVNGKAYNGPAQVQVTAGEKTLTKKAYINRGFGEVSFNGFDFGTWQKDFTGSVSIKDVSKNFEITYK